MRLSILLATSQLATVLAGLHDFQYESSNWTIGQTILTSSGLVKGHAASNDSEVSEYLGIPFARAPVGDLRFAPPVRFNGSGLLSGAAFGPSCPIQEGTHRIPTLANLLRANITAAAPQILALTSNFGANYSEDCLFLNVWTRPQVGEKKKAVMVWIYGGGFNCGSSTTPLYHGAKLAEMEDVIVVTLNYRLSILGFPGNPTGPQNLGLLDQRLAIEWVRDNIENFGGDPSRIILFGQSAGGASTDFYSYAWSSDPIISGLIVQSGSATSWGLPYTPDVDAAAWYNVSAAVGCGDSASDPNTVLSCMRSTNYSSIIKAIPVSIGLNSVLSIFGPTIDEKAGSKGFLLPDDFWEDANLQQFTCPGGIRAKASVAAGNPTWRYRYFGEFANLAFSSDAGSWHGAELHMIFDKIPVIPPSTREQVAIGKYMRKAWTSFAKDSIHGLANYGWPAYDPDAETLVRLAWENQAGTNVALPSLYDEKCGNDNIPDAGV